MVPDKRKKEPRDSVRAGLPRIKTKDKDLVPAAAEREGETRETDREGERTTRKNEGERERES